MGVTKWGVTSGEFSLKLNKAKWIISTGELRKVDSCFTFLHICIQHGSKTAIALMGLNGIVHQDPNW